MATITSPGNKLWEFEYNDLGQPTVMTYPNGMVKEWGYDARDRLTSLVYRDQPLGNVLASYTYVLDDLFNVTAMVEADGTIWTYEYDDRYRLTEAVRHNHIFPTIKANYAYTYDASDNMLTKVEPYEDKFNDTNFTGWTPLNSSWWQVVDGKLTTVVQSWTHVMEKQFSDADHELQFDYVNKNTSNNSYGVSATLRQASAGGRVAVTFFPNRAELSEYVPGTGWVVRATDTGATTTQDATYHVKGVCDGSSVKVWRWQDGEMPAQVFSYTTAYTDSWRIYFSTPAYSNFAIDNVRILADDLSTTSTFTVNDADELVSMADTNGGTTYFEYDAWGRMSRKYMGSSGSPTFEATYEYKYDDKLVAVESNFPDEGDVSYTYGADGQRRSRTADGVTTTYNWGIDGVMSEADASGTLLSTFVAKIGEIQGSIPSSSPYAYFVSDALTSMRVATDEQQSSVCRQEFSPFGSIVNRSGAAVQWSYVGHHWDSDAGMYMLRFRSYSPEIARWLSREPSGLDQPNLYWYCLNNPVTYIDLDGRCALVPFILAGAIAGGISGAICGATSNAPHAPRWENIVAGTVIGTLTGAMAGLGLGYAATVGAASATGVAISVGMGAFAGGTTSLVGSGGSASAGVSGAIIGGITGGMVPYRSLIDLGYTTGYIARVGGTYLSGVGAICAP